MHSGPNRKAPGTEAAADGTPIAEVWRALDADFERACEGLAEWCTAEAKAAVPKGATPPHPSREELERIRAADWEQACKGLAGACVREHRESSDRSAGRGCSQEAPAEKSLEQCGENASS